MRLICPICEAKYEVPEDAIPETGRDVQCANCGHAWFQMRPRAESAAAGAPLVPSPAPQSPAAEPLESGAGEPFEPAADVARESVAVEASIEPVDAIVGDTATSDVFPEDALDIEPDLPQDLQPEPADDQPAASAYAVDDGVLAILREEAEREASARRAEAGALENQPDLGIEAAIPERKGKKSSPAAAAKPAPVVEIELEAEERPAARRDLLPDVEEINSTLRPSEQAEDATEVEYDDQDEESSGGGFRAGFLLVMTIAILAAGLYVSAPKLTALVPSLADPLSAYVAAVDDLRMWLDGLMQQATAAINGQ